MLQIKENNLVDVASQQANLYTLQNPVFTI